MVPGPQPFLILADTPVSAGLLVCKEAKSLVIARLPNLDRMAGVLPTRTLSCGFCWAKFSYERHEDMAYYSGRGWARIVLRD
jgi:hypothetical protein